MTVHGDDSAVASSDSDIVAMLRLGLDAMSMEACNLLERFDKSMGPTQRVIDAPSNLARISISS
jgi:hypothetical protein